MLNLTITSCKRPDLFAKTISTFVDKCLDKHRINKIIWADDNTLIEHHYYMSFILKASFPNIEIVDLYRNGYNRGLHFSWNDILKHVDTKYIMHLEDDWECINEGSFITEALDILKTQDHVKQVLLHNNNGFENIFPTKSSPSGRKYAEWTKGEALDGQYVDYSGFTFNPTVTDIQFYRDKYGDFSSEEIERSYEHCYEDGVRTGILLNSYFKHIGLGDSSFVLNQTNR